MPHSHKNTEFMIHRVPLHNPFPHAASIGRLNQLDLSHETRPILYPWSKLLLDEVGGRDVRAPWVSTCADDNSLGNCKIRPGLVQNQCLEMRQLGCEVNGHIWEWLKVVKTNLWPSNHRGLSSQIGRQAELHLDWLLETKERLDHHHSPRIHRALIKSWWLTKTYI